jgi:hypothetical protein
MLSRVRRLAERVQRSLECSAMDLGLTDRAAIVTGGSRGVLVDAVASIL